MPLWLGALMWGTVAGVALVLGAAASWKWAIPSKLDSSVMSFGAGVLISALAFELVDEAVQGVTAGSVSPAMLAAVVISNVPEGLSGTAGMKKAGRGARYIFGVWGSIAVLCGLASLIGYVALENAPDAVIAFITAIAAGGILAMLADTMIPEAFEEHHNLTGLTASVGFLTAFTVHQVGG